MKFCDLLSLEYDESRGIIPIEILSKNNINAPKEVMMQFYSDHGRKDEFQKQYGHIILNKINWEKINVLAEKLIECSIYKGFNNYVNGVG